MNQFGQEIFAATMPVGDRCSLQPVNKIPNRNGVGDGAFEQHIPTLYHLTKGYLI
jgi:hypothetical protein